MYPDLGAIPAWARDALCQEPEYLDPPWFPDAGEALEECRAVCRKCLVVDECFEYAMSDPVTRKHGIWGGTTPNERRKKPKKRPTYQPREYCEVCGGSLPRGRVGLCVECVEWKARYELV